MSRWLNRVITFTCTMAIVALLSALVRSHAAPTIATDSAVNWNSSQLDRIAQLMVPNRLQTRYRTNDMWQLVYQAMPDLPLENQYINIETGAIDDDYTLMRRLIRYHVYVKNRPPLFRLDWKLTLADYLTVRDPNTGQTVSANERINPTTYPGNNVLTVASANPSAGEISQPMSALDGDRAAIARLTPEQRDRLVDILTMIFNPTYADAVAAHAAIEAAQDRTADPVSNPAERDLPRAPQAGDANLLIPGSSR
jgi:hypothetical protein